MKAWEMLSELSKIVDENYDNINKPIHVLLRRNSETISFIPTTIKIYKDEKSGNTGIFIE